MREFDTTKKTNTTIQKAEYYESKKNTQNNTKSAKTSQPILSTEYKSTVKYETLNF